MRAKLLGLVAYLGARKHRARELERKAYYAFPPRRRPTGRLEAAAVGARLLLVGLLGTGVLIATGWIR